MLLKKEIGKSSGPGALSLARLKTVDLTSSSRNSPSSQIAASLVMVEKLKVVNERFNSTIFAVNVLKVVNYVAGDPLSVL